MKYETPGEGVRETLHNLRRFRGKKIVIAPSGIGNFDSADVALLLDDVALMDSMGVAVILAGEHPSLPSEPAGCKRVAVSGMSLVEMAVREGAIKICLMCSSDALHAAEGNLDNVSIEVAEDLFRRGKITGDARVAFELALAACRGGVPRVHFFNVRRPNALLTELFTARGEGTMISGDQYKHVRCATADDVLTLFRMLSVHRPGLRHESGLRYLRNFVTQFRVFEVDGEAYGCAEIRSQKDTLELHALSYVNKHNPSEVLEHLLAHAVGEAINRRFSRVSVLEAAIPPMMIIQPWIGRLGFVRESAGTRTRLVKRITASAPA